MTTIHSILDHDTTKWIGSNIDHLNGRDKFCALNAIRFLVWADEIFEISPIVASFCAVHATEEAVVSFISAAKKSGHEKYAKSVNLRSHPNKALVSILANRLANSAEKGKLGFSVNPNGDCLAYRLPTNEGYQYGDLHLSIFRLGDSDGQNLDKYTPLGDLPSLDEVKKEATDWADVRNKLIYATDKGFRSGFERPMDALIKQAQLSLGLIWAAIDVTRYPYQDASFVKDLLKGMASFDTKGKNCSSA